MAKLHKAYENKKLIEALKDRDSVYDSVLSNVNAYDDEQLAVLSNISKLTQFQKDLLYLSSQMSVYDVADLYAVSASLLYSHLRDIQKILHNI